MSLIDLWKETPDQLRDKRVDQIIGFAGDGKLGDSNTAPDEFRAFLARVPSDHLIRYADECLSKSFSDSGLALQDIVNEMARRIGFEVEYGRYRGTKGQIGFDGIWTAPDGQQIVVEVKTTDAYRLQIETVATYRRLLVKQDRLTEDASSILIVVGRSDTGELEAQIRGSRYAWDVRVISIDSLASLMKIRQEVEDPATEHRIRSILIPREYTRLDDIIELVFSTAEDIQDDLPPEEGEDRTGAEANPSGRAKPVAFHNAVADVVSQHLGVALAKESRVVYSDPDAGVTVSCAVSKAYGDDKAQGYWFGFLPHQLEKLQAATRGYAAFGCGSAARIALFPVDELVAQLDYLNRTANEQHQLWHVQIDHDVVSNRWSMRRSKGKAPLDISDMMVLADASAT